MSVCRLDQSLLASAVDGDLDETRLEEVQAHARRCPDCGAAMDFYARLRADLESSRPIAPPPLYFEGVLAEINRRLDLRGEARPAVRRRRWRRRHAASLVLSALLAVWCCAAFSMLGPLDLRPGWLERIGRVDAAAKPLLASAASRPQEVRLVILEGVGIISAQSPILDMPRAELKQLGYWTEPPTKLAEARRKGDTVTRWIG